MKGGDLTEIRFHCYSTVQEVQPMMVNSEHMPTSVDLLMNIAWSSMLYWKASGLRMARNQLYS